MIKVGVNYSSQLGRRPLAAKNERQTMHLILFTPILATDDWVAPSAAAFLVIISVVALCSRKA
jgi:hypothetical protein